MPPNEIIIARRGGKKVVAMRNNEIVRRTESQILAKQTASGREEKKRFSTYFSGKCNGTATATHVHRVFSLEGIELYSPRTASPG